MDVTPLQDICDACEWGVRSVEDFIADPHHQDVLVRRLSNCPRAMKADDANVVFMSQH